MNCACFLIISNIPHEFSLAMLDIFGNEKAHAWKKIQEHNKEKIMKIIRKNKQRMYARVSSLAKLQQMVLKISNNSFVALLSFSCH